MCRAQRESKRERERVDWRKKITISNRTAHSAKMYADSLFLSFDNIVLYFLFLRDFRRYSCREKKNSRHVSSILLFFPSLSILFKITDHDSRQSERERERSSRFPPSRFVLLSFQSSWDLSPGRTILFFGEKREKAKLMTKKNEQNSAQPSPGGSISMTSTSATTVTNTATTSGIIIVQQQPLSEQQQHFILPASNNAGPMIITTPLGTVIWFTRPRLFSNLIFSWSCAFDADSATANNECSTITTNDHSCDE